ncbi:hypothetical protein [Bradyrhizobium sp. SZCCHNS2005]|nr:hypothetical protein [Bradyrhizobium sp. SZCCHNS2005]
MDATYDGNAQRPMKFQHVGGGQRLAVVIKIGHSSLLSFFNREFPA